MVEASAKSLSLGVGRKSNDRGGGEERDRETRGEWIERWMERLKRRERGNIP